jgi:elongation factor G
MTMAIKTDGKDEDKVATAIAKILDEDKTVKYENFVETGELLLKGIGDVHLDTVVCKLKNRYGVNISLVQPKIAYRETIKKTISVEGKHKKQSGGAGQYGHVKITFSHSEENEGLTFTTSVVGGEVPKNYFPAVEKGLQEAMAEGVLLGYPMVNLAADLTGGSYHDVDSNELSFKLASTPSATGYTSVYAQNGKGSVNRIGTETDENGDSAYKFYVYLEKGNNVVTMNAQAALTVSRVTAFI